MDEKHPFWTFSLQVYGAEGVAPACLELQEACGVDVNVLLFCCWVGASGRGALEGAEMRQALEAVSDWHQQVVRAMRAVRQRLKGGFAGMPTEKTEALRQKILGTEINAEHLEQLRLAETVAARRQTERPPDILLVDIAQTIAGYAAAAELAGISDHRDALVTVVAAALPGLEEAKVAAALDQALTA